MRVFWRQSTYATLASAISPIFWLSQALEATHCDARSAPTAHQLVRTRTDSSRAILDAAVGIERACVSWPPIDSFSRVACLLHVLYVLQLLPSSPHAGAAGRRRPASSVLLKIEIDATSGILPVPMPGYVAAAVHAARARKFFILLQPGQRDAYSHFHSMIHVANCTSTAAQH
jgi:hypothetical protein